MHRSTNPTLTRSHGDANVITTGIVLLLSVLAQRLDGQTAIVLENLRLNAQGVMLVDVVLRQAPPPPGGVVDIEFQYSNGERTVSETVRGGVGGVNVRRTVSARQPFPCDQTYQVTATLKNSGASPVQTSAVLSRRCTRTQGTPDLAVISAVRVNGGLDSPRETPIRIRVTVGNISAFNMAFNEQGGIPWTVQVTPGTSGSADGGTGGVQTFRLPLQARQQHTFDVMPVALPCGKESQIQVVVDRDGVIAESDESNNRKSFMIAGNRCQDAG